MTCFQIPFFVTPLSPILTPLLPPANHKQACCEAGAVAALERVKRDGNAAAKAKAEEALVEVQDAPPAYGMHSREQRAVEKATVNQYGANSTRHMGKWFIIENEW